MILRVPTCLRPCWVLCWLLSLFQLAHLQAGTQDQGGDTDNEGEAGEDANQDTTTLLNTYMGSRLTSVAPASSLLAFAYAAGACATGAGRTCQTGRRKRGAFHDAQGSLQEHHMNLVTALLHDDDLRKDLKQIQVGAGPIHAEYKNFLQNQRGKDLHFCELMQFGPYRSCFLDDLTRPSPHS